MNEAEFRSPAIDLYRSLRRKHLVSALLLRQRTTQPAGALSRQNPRADVRLPLTLQIDEWETDTVTENISIGGCAFWLSRVPDLTHFNFALTLQAGAVLRGRARVVATIARDERFLICLCFENLNEAQLDALEQTVLDVLVPR